MRDLALSPHRSPRVRSRNKRHRPARRRGPRRRLLEPLRGETFSYSRAWLRDQGAHLSNRGNPAASVGRRFNLPPNYMLIHRVSLGGLGILCQLGATFHVRAVLGPYLPGLDEDADETG